MIFTEKTMKSKILIVDDEQNIREIFEKIFSNDYTVFTAANGGIALEIITREKPSLVLVDIVMPVMDGIDVLKKIKTMKDRPSVIVLTSSEDVRTATKALELGARSYITKPFEVDEIKKIVVSEMARIKTGNKPDQDKPWVVKKK